MKIKNVKPLKRPIPTIMDESDLAPNMAVTVVCDIEGIETIGEGNPVILAKPNIRLSRTGMPAERTFWLADWVFGPYAADAVQRHFG